MKVIRKLKEILWFAVVEGIPQTTQEEQWKGRNFPFFLSYSHGWWSNMATHLHLHLQTHIAHCAMRFSPTPKPIPTIPGQLPYKRVMSDEHWWPHFHRFFMMLWGRRHQGARAHNPYSNLPRSMQKGGRKSCTKASPNTHSLSHYFGSLTVTGHIKNPKWGGGDLLYSKTAPARVYTPTPPFPLWGHDKLVMNEVMGNNGKKSLASSHPAWPFFGAVFWPGTLGRWWGP